MDNKNIPIPNRQPLEQQYEAQRPRYEKILNELQQNIKILLNQISLHPTIKVRVKSFESYYNKILNRIPSQRQERIYNITDILGM